MGKRYFVTHFRGTVHQTTYQGDICPICEMVEERQQLIDRALQAEQRLRTMRDIFQCEVIELANLAQMVDPELTKDCMERIYDVFVSSDNA